EGSRAAEREGIAIASWPDDQREGRGGSERARRRRPGPKPAAFARRRLRAFGLRLCARDQSDPPGALLGRQIAGERRQLQDVAQLALAVVAPREVLAEVVGLRLGQLAVA